MTRVQIVEITGRSAFRVNRGRPSERPTSKQLKRLEELKAKRARDHEVHERPTRSREAIRA